MAFPSADLERVRLWSPRCLAFVLVGALLASWPVVVFGEMLINHDSLAYVRNGGLIVAYLENLLGLAAPVSGAAGAAEVVVPSANDVRTLRSPVYALFVYVGSLGHTSFTVLAILQNALLLIAVWPLAQRRVAGLHPLMIMGAAALCLSLTSLPWFGAYMMPDGFGAVVVLYFAVLVSEFDRLDGLSKLMLGAVAAFAILTHYGNIPLAFACLVAAFAIRLVQRRPLGLFAVALVAPLLLTLAANLVISAATAPEGKTASVAPKRVPVMLARSIEDGPARWHLTEACDRYHYVVCSFWDEVPERVDKILWGPDGLHGRSRVDLDRVRAEEPLILWRSFKSYPLQQLWSLAGNSVEAFFEVGLNEHSFGAVKASEEEPRPNIERGERRDLLSAFGNVQLVVYLLSLGGMVVIVLRRPWPIEDINAIIIVVAAGLAANALIFGGLSSPVDRYQGRIAWVPTVIVTLYLLEQVRVRWPQHSRAMLRGGPAGKIL